MLERLYLCSRRVKCSRVSGYFNVALFPFQYNAVCPNLEEFGEHLPIIFFNVATSHGRLILSVVRIISHVNMVNTYPQH